MPRLLKKYWLNFSKSFLFVSIRQTTCNRLKSLNPDIFTEASSATETDKSLPKIQNITKNESETNNAKLTKKSLEVFKNMGYKDAISMYPKLLSMDSVLLKNKMLLLNECGVNREEIPSCTVRFKYIFNREISLLKRVNIIPREINVKENLFNLLDIPKSDITIESTDSCSIKTVYYEILNFYLKKELDTTEDFHFPKNPNLIVGLKALRYNFKILKNVIGLSNEKIRSNIKLIQVDPEDVMILLQFSKELNMKEIIKKVPALILKPRERIIKNCQLLLNHGISPKTILRHPTFLFRKTELIEKKLELIVNNPVLNPYQNDPRFLCLLDLSNMVISRLETLSKHNVQCFTINQILISKKFFDNSFIRTNYKVRNVDVINFISRSLEKPKLKVAEELRKNPFLGYIPLQTIQETLQYLQNSNFNNDDILFSLQLLLYNKYIVKDAVDNLVPQLLESMGDQRSKNIDNKTYLAMVLYCLEKDYQFSGSGVWKMREISNNTQDLYDK